MHTKTMRCAACVALVWAAAASPSSWALDNPRLLQFSGQAVPAAPASNVTVSSADGSMTIDSCAQAPA